MKFFGIPLEIVHIVHYTLGMNTYISPTILSNAFGVSPSTLKRWSDKGILKSDRTRGGHRRFSISEAIRMSRNLGIPFRNPESIGLPEPILPTGISGGREPFELLHEALKAEDLHESQRIVLGLFLSGMPLVELLEDVVTPVISRLGMQWVKTHSGIASEHAATQMLLETLGTLKNLLPTAEGRVLAIGGAPAGDPYRIPTTMAALTVQDLGFKSVNLGPNLPLESLVEYARKERPRLAWLSTTSSDPMPMLQRKIHSVAEELHSLGVLLVAGGRQTGKLTRRPIPNLIEFRSLKQFRAFCERLLTPSNI